MLSSPHQWSVASGCQLPENQSPRTSVALPAGGLRTYASASKAVLNTRVDVPPGAVPCTCPSLPRALDSSGRCGHERWSCPPGRVPARIRTEQPSPLLVLPQTCGSVHHHLPLPDPCDSPGKPNVRAPSALRPHSLAPCTAFELRREGHGEGALFVLELTFTQRTRASSLSPEEKAEDLHPVRPAPQPGRRVLGPWHRLEWRRQ